MAVLYRYRLCFRTASLVMRNNEYFVIILIDAGGVCSNTCNTKSKRVREIC